MNEFARNNEIVEYSIKHYDLDAKKDGITTLLPNNSIGKIWTFASKDLKLASEFN